MNTDLINNQKRQVTAGAGNEKENMKTKTTKTKSTKKKVSKVSSKLEQELYELTWQLERNERISNLVAAIGLDNLIITDSDDKWLGVAGSFSVDEDGGVFLKLRKIT